MRRLLTYYRIGLTPQDDNVPDILAELLRNCPVSAIDTSIIIVNWNTCDVLRNCLRSVYEQTEIISFEVIVVDNASPDSSVEMVRTEFPQVKLIENTENRGFAAACNQGLCAANARYCLLLNSDTFVLDRALEKAVIYADAHTNIGVLGCRALWPDGRHQYTCFRFPNLANIAIGSIFMFRFLSPFVRPVFHRERYLERDFDQEQDVDVVAGCFFLVRREVINQVGLLDEDFFMYGEEAEWCYRIRKAGWRIVYYPGARIVHIYGGSSDQLVDKMTLAKRRSQLLFLHKTRGGLYAWCGNAIMTIGVVLRAPLWFVADVLNLIKKRGSQSSLLRRFKIAGFHMVGLLWPIWR